MTQYLIYNRILIINYVVYLIAIQDRITSIFYAWAFAKRLKLISITEFKLGSSVCDDQLQGDSPRSLPSPFCPGAGAPACLTGNPEPTSQPHRLGRVSVSPVACWNIF